MGLEELPVKLRESVKLVNAQHKRIFDATTVLFSHCVGDEDGENKFFGKTIASVIKIYSNHFKTEEDLMLEMKFNVYEFVEHKKEHNDFIMAVTEHLKRFQETGGIDHLTFTSYARWWIIGHIKNFDKKYIQHLNRAAGGKGKK